MASDTRSGIRGVERRSKLIVALLLLMVTMTGVLTYQAQDAARSHRVTAEWALHTYAGIAAWTLGWSAEQVLFPRMAQNVDSIQVELPAVATDSRVGGPGAGSLESCRCFRGPKTGIRFALTNGGRTLISEEPLPPLTRTWILDSAFARRGGAPHRGGLLSLVFPLGDSTAVLFTKRPGADGRSQVLIGVVRPALEVTDFFPDMMKLAKALPDSLLHGLSNDAVLSLRVTTPGGLQLYSTPRVYAPTFSATEPLPPYFGSLRMHVALRPQAAATLVVGGVPRSRLPLLLGFLALTLALCVLALQQLRRETELARMREDFVSSVSHELRTPLAQIRMFTETLLLGRTRSDAERRRSLEIIDQEAKRLTHLVENVLRISRAARGISRVVPENVELTAEVVTNIESFRLFASQKRVELRPELQAGVMGVVDRGGLRQMLLNLLDNALKYGPAGQRVVVGLALVEDRARIWVDDEGPGIAPEDREKVFDPFYRSPRDAGSSVAGSGIGLAVVRELATLHGGRAWADAAPGGGARITIEIPGAYVRTPVTEGDWVAA